MEEHMHTKTRGYTHTKGNTDGLFVPDLIMVWLLAFKLAGGSFVPGSSQEIDKRISLC